MKNDCDEVNAIRVPVHCIPAAPASVMRGASDCACRDCSCVRKLLWVAPGEAQTKPGELSLVQIAELFRLAIAVRDDVCLMYAQRICESAGTAISITTWLSAATKHTLEQAHAVDRDRLDSCRAGLWFESALACKVGGKRARDLWFEAIKRKFNLGKYFADHCDEYGLAFTFATQESIDRAAVDWLVAMGEPDWAGKPS